MGFIIEVLSLNPFSITLRTTVLNYEEDSSLQQYAEIPKQKHVGGYTERHLMHQTHLTELQGIIKKTEPQGIIKK